MLVLHRNLQTLSTCFAPSLRATLAWSCLWCCCSFSLAPPTKEIIDKDLLYGEAKPGIKNNENCPVRPLFVVLMLLFWSLMVFLPLPSELHCHSFSFTSPLFQPISISSTHNVNPERLGTVFFFRGLHGSKSSESILYSAYPNGSANRHKCSSWESCHSQVECLPTNKIRKVNWLLV